MPATVVGGLSASLAAGTGLREGLPVVMGANDSSSAAWGAGVVDGGSILNISGSNEIVTIALERPLPHEKVYLRTHVIGGRWLCLAITVGGSALEWFRRELCREMDPEEFYGRYLPDLVERRFGGETGGDGPRNGSLREGGTRGPDSSVAFAPHLAGDRHRIGRRKASFTGLTLGSSREDMLAAVLLGVLDPMRTALDIYGKKIALDGAIALTGGLSGSVPVAFKERVFPGFRFRPVPDAAALGNCRLALDALRITS
jgi:sugar (pentulose or hexulose) kinase